MKVGQSSDGTGAARLRRAGIPMAGSETARRRGVSAWLLLWPMLVGVNLYPIRSPHFDILLVVLPVALWVGGLALSGKRTRAWLGVFGLLAALFLIAPGRPVDCAALRRIVVSSLIEYRGVPYVWGGETKRGVDCSGLVRCGLYDGEMRLGLRTLNPVLVRESVSLWWHDCTARSLMEGYRGLCRPVQQASCLNRLDYSGLRPGDFVITANGMHALAYLGHESWIEAEPGGVVTELQVGGARSIWLAVPVRVMRWRILDS